MYAFALAAVVVVALAGCGLSWWPGGEDPGLRPTPSSSPAPADPADVDAGGDAIAEALTRFDETARAVIAAEPAASGADFVAALVAAGFDPAAIQVTSDTTTLGDRADSIQFAVRIGEDCLVGQYGPKSDGYLGAVQPGLGAGGCLVGATGSIPG
ncbi:hypothetical protein GCM10025870_33070 [Agromyces marinus]|uniref:DUF6993 domain-containing protein n=1 Tax=Agromyces marinus TaxID=1389020 RepID=A0ABM8H604_9MICO|nr:hypothetical protein GCM10025870_33070 [Agromyces marinus]